MRCALCGEEVPELQLIESIYEFDPEAVARVLGDDGVLANTLGADTLAVCPDKCADKLRANSITILRDEPFRGQK